MRLSFSFVVSSRTVKFAFIASPTSNSGIAPNYERSGRQLMRRTAGGSSNGTHGGFRDWQETTPEIDNGRVYAVNLLAGDRRGLLDLTARAMVST